MNELFKKNCLTSEVDLTLEALIEGCKKSRIKSIAARYGVKLSDKLTKQQMMEETIPCIEINFGLRVKQYSDDDIETMLNCMKSVEIDEQAAEKIIKTAPFEDGAIYVCIKKDKFLPCVPDELAGKFMEYCAGHFFRNNYDVLTLNAKACALIYGTFTPEMMANTVNSAYDCNYSAEQIAEYLSSAQINELTYSEGMAKCTYAEPAEINALAEKLDYDIPKRKEIEAYACYGLNSTDYYYRQIVNFIYSKSGITYDKCNKLMQNIALWCMTDGELSDIFKYIQQSEPNISTEQFNFLLNMIGELSNRTRKWSLKGHRHCDVKGTSPIRMPQVQKKQAPETVHIETVRAMSKVGRNDPCPCGSGKKYKKCCGRKKL